MTEAKKTGRARTAVYWVSTGLVAFAMLAGGVMDLIGGEEIAASMAQLGYPAYFALILGVWKLGGAVVIAAPRLRLVKEWAYAGIFFDLSGAAASHAAVGDEAAKIITPLVLLVLTCVSWTLRPSTRRLAGARLS